MLLYENESFSVEISSTWWLQVVARLLQLRSALARPEKCGSSRTRRKRSNMQAQASQPFTARLLLDRESSFGQESDLVLRQERTFNN